MKQPEIFSSKGETRSHTSSQSLIQPELSISTTVSYSWQAFSAFSFFPELCIPLGSVKLGINLEISQKQNLMKFSRLYALISLKVCWHSQHQLQPSHGCAGGPAVQNARQLQKVKFKVFLKLPRSGAIISGQWLRYESSYFK